MIDSVLHVFQPRSEGVPRYVGDLASAQADRGMRVGVACHPDADRRFVSSEVHRIDWRCSPKPLRNVANDAMSLRSIIREQQPDVIHLHSSHAGLIGRLPIVGKRPIVFQPHAWSFHAMPGPRALARAAVGWERVAARRTGAWLTDSTEEIQEGVSIGLPTERLSLAGRMVDTDSLGPSDRSMAKERLGLSDRPTVVSVGRLSKQKGMDTLVRAWSLVAQRFPSWQLVIVGDGPDAERLGRLAPASVRFVGSQSDCVPWYQASDIFALASRWEGGSLAVVEALACGAPLVLTDVSGMSEAITTTCGPAGVLVTDIEEPEAFAEALERIMSNESFRDDCSRRARDHAVSSFSFDAALDRVGLAYSTAIARSTL